MFSKDNRALENTLVGLWMHLVEALWDPGRRSGDTVHARQEAGLNRGAFCCSNLKPFFDYEFCPAETVRPRLVSSVDIPLVSRCEQRIERQGFRRLCRIQRVGWDAPKGPIIIELANTE